MEHRPCYERYQETLGEIDRLNVQLLVLETCSHNKLGEFARPFSLRPGNQPMEESTIDLTELSPTFVSIRHLYDENGTTIYERFLRCHMRLVALSSLVYGSKSVEAIASIVQLAASYLRAGLWKQCNEHASAANDLLKEFTVDGDNKLTFSTRQMDAQLHYAHCLFKKLDCDGDGRVTHEELLSALATDDYFTHLRSKAHTLPNAFAALCDPMRFNSVFKQVDVDDSGQIEWLEVVQFLSSNDTAFQNYCKQLENALPPSFLQALKSVYDEAGGITTALSVNHLQHAFAQSQDALLNNMATFLTQSKSVGTKLLSWPETLEVARRSIHVNTYKSLQPHILLLLGRCFIKRGQIDEAFDYLRRAVSEQQVVVGANAHEMVDYYVALSEILVLRHNQSIQIARDMAASRFNRWLASPEGAQRIRSEAIRILEEANNAKIKLPTKREAEQQARDYLQNLHAEREEKRTPVITPFLEEATELCTKVWSMEEEKYGSDHINTAIAYAGLGNTYIVRNEPNEAIVYFSKAIETLNIGYPHGIPVGAFLKMHMAKIYLHLNKPEEAMNLLNEAALFFKDHAGKFLDADITRRDCAANAIDAWTAWLQMASKEDVEAMHTIHQNIVDVASIGYGEFSIEVADAQANLGHFLLKHHPNYHKQGEDALDAASYIYQVHHGNHDKKVRRLKQEVLASAAKRKHIESPVDHAWIIKEDRTETSLLFDTMAMASVAPTPEGHTSTTRAYFSCMICVNPSRTKVPTRDGSGCTNNAVSSTKYSKLTFLPLNLLEQLRRPVNMFYLVVSTLEICSSSSPMDKYSTLATFMLVLVVNMIKDGVEENARSENDRKLNQTRTLVWNGKTFEQRMWQEIHDGDIVKICEYEAFPADMLLVQSSHDDFSAFVDASRLNGQAEFNVKECLAVHSKELGNPLEYGTSITAELHCHPPTRDLTQFNGILCLSNKEIIEETPFTSTHVVLRGTRLVNTAFVTGIVLATGNATKLMQNHRRYSTKSSQVDQFADRCVGIAFLLLVVLTFVSAIKGHLRQASMVGASYLALDQAGMSFLSVWITHFILYSNMIPISLYATIELVKWCQAIQMERDFHLEAKSPMRPQSSKLNADLGSISYIFTDKTGTLTKNEMVLSKVSVSGHLVEYQRSQQKPLEPGYLDVKEFVKVAHEQQNESIREMFRCMLLCHNASILQSSNVISCSPDEVALLTAATDFDCSFNGRAGPHIQIVVFGELECYTLLACIEFDSKRKCMTVVVQRSLDGAIIMYCKGADSVLFSSSKDSKNTQLHVQSFAKSGLRTLVFARKRLPSIDAWLDEYNAATTASNNREQAIESVAMKLEQIGQMDILGCTGIQDTLQDGVSASIRLLTKAGLRLWMLTGDKEETSIATAYACGLITPSTKVLTINGINQRECLEQIAQYRKKLKRDGLWHPGTLNPFMSIVVPGKTLELLLPEQSLQRPSRKAQIAPSSPHLDAHYLFELLSQCRSVIACRLSPDQKANVVCFVKKYGSLTLAIGDGGNDAAMIQEANVGVGILSTQDNQAVQCSDYALTQFSSLTSLVLLHGRWNYRSLVLVVLFILYKNVVLSTIFCMNSFGTNFSGQLPFDSSLIAGWNVVYTCFPLLVLGIVDRDITAPVVLAFPRIYLEKDIDLSTKTVLLWLAKGAFQAVVATMLINGIVETSILDTGGIFLYGIILLTVALLIVLMQSTLIMQRWHRWSVWHFGALFGSLLGVILFIAICEQVDRVFPYASSLYNISGLLFQANWYMVLLLLILVPFSSCLPEFVWYAVEKLYMYNNLHILQEIDSGLGIDAIVPMVTTTKKSQANCSNANFDENDSNPNQISDCEHVIQQLKSFRLKTQCLEHEQESYNLDIQMHPVTMEFIGHLSSKLEREYCIAFFSQESMRVCRTVFIATIFYLINVLIRYFLMDESTLYLVSRCAIVGCAFIYAIAARTRLFQKHYDVLLVIFMISAGILISTAIQSEGYITFTLFPIALFTIFRIKFAWALSLVAVNFVVFLLIAFSQESSKTGLGFFTGYVLFVIIFAASGSWRVQLAMRQDFLQRRSLALEERRALNILQHMLPSHIMSKLQHGDPIISEAEDDVTILFCDVVDFSKLMQQYSPAAVVSLLDHLYSLFDELCAKYGVQKMETVGKTYMACAGLQESTTQYKVSPALRAACMALEMLHLIDACTTKQGPLIKIRIGLHSGRVISGLVGRKKQQFSLFGDTVNTASRMQSTGTPGSCQVSQTTRDKLIHDFTFSCPNQVFVKGKGDMETYILGDPLSEQAIQWHTKPRNMSADKTIRSAEPVSSMEQTLNDEMRSELHSLWLQFHDPEMETEYLNATSTAREEATTRCLSAWGLYVIFALLRDFSQAAIKSNNGFNFLLLFVIPRLIYLGIIGASLFWVRLGQKYLFHTSCYGVFALGALHVDKIFFSDASSGISEFNLLALDIVWIMFVLSSGGAMLYVQSIAFNMLSCLFMLSTTMALCINQTCEYDVGYAIVVVVFTALANVLISHDIEFFTRRKVWLETQTNIQTRTADRLLYQRLPEEVVTRMKQGQLICDEYRLVGILYSDIKGFTSIAARSDPEQVIQMLDSLFAAFDILTEKHGVFKLQTIGDAYVIVSGLPFIDMSLTQDSLPIHDNGTSPQRRKSDRMRAHRLAQQHANLRRTNIHLKKPCLHVHQHIRNLLQMAMDMHEEVAKIRDPKTNEPLQMRIGVHLGNMIGGVIGDTTLRYDMWGLDAMFANTLESNGLPGGVVVSEAVKNVVEEAHDDIKCTYYKTLDTSDPIYTVEFDHSKRENTCPSPRKSNLTSGVASPLRRKLFS